MESIWQNKALESNGYEIDDEMSFIFNKWRKTHNQGVFDAYTDEMRLARKTKLLLGYLMLMDVGESLVIIVV